MVTRIICKSLLAAVLAVSLGACTQLLVATLNQVELTELAVEDNRLYLLGEFNSQTRDAVLNTLDSHPQINTIVLTANGGSLDDEVTFSLARELRARQLNTHLLSNSVIASGAVDLFLAGVERTSEQGAMLGVHSWSDGRKEGKDFPKEHAAHDLNASYIRDMLGNDAFYWFTIYSATADSIHWMSAAEIKQYGMLTAPALAATHDETPFGSQFIQQRSELLEDTN